MKRNFLLLGISILVITIGMPYGTSLLLQHRYYQVINQLSEKTIGVELTGKFMPGWLTSKAITSLKEKGADDVFLELEHSFANGPLIVDLTTHKIQAWKLAIVTTTIKNKQLQALNDFLYAGKEGLIITTEINYNGAGITNIRNLSFVKKLAQEQIEWGGLDIVLRHGQGFPNLTSEIIMPTLIYKEGDNTLEVQKLTGTGEQQVTPEGWWQKHGDVNIKHFAIKSGTDELFSIDNFKSIMTVAIKDKVVDFALQLKLANILAPMTANKVGPWVVGLNFSDLDIAAIEQLKQLKRIKNNNDPVALNSYVCEVWKKFALRQPKITIKNTEFNLPQGKLTLVADVKVNDKNITNINSMPLVIKSIDALVKIELPKTLAYEIVAKKIERDILLESQDFNLTLEGKKIPAPYKLTLQGKKEEIEKRVLEEMTKLIAEKMVLEKEKTFFAEITMQDGLVKVNGQEIAF